MKSLLPIVAILVWRSVLFAQPGCSLSHGWDYPYGGNISPLTLEADVMGRPYVYVASNEYGLRILSTNGTHVTTLDTNDLQMRVMSFTQYDTLLYVVIGSQFDGLHPDPPGLVTVSVAEPQNPVVLDYWIRAEHAKETGGGMVVVENGIAYLAGMYHGLILLDVSNPSDIQYKSEVFLDFNFPFNNPPLFDRNKFNARGVAVRNDTAFVCYDRGGLRIVDCTDKLNPVEINKYIKPNFYVQNNAIAYNNIVLDGDVAYLTVDWCGIEAIDVSHPGDTIVLLDHFDPYDCMNNPWAEAEWHTNEMKFSKDCNKIFVSCGKSELVVMDVTDPLNLDSCGAYGTFTDSSATWGVGMRNDSLFLSYMKLDFYIPGYSAFRADWAGITMVKWTNPCPPAFVREPLQETRFDIYPNPATGEFFLQAASYCESAMVRMYSPDGKMILEESFTGFERVLMDTKAPPGIYVVTVSTARGIQVLRLVIQ